jgi:hypothetical protein
MYIHVSLLHVTWLSQLINSNLTVVTLLYLSLQNKKYEMGESCSIHRGNEHIKFYLENQMERWLWRCINGTVLFKWKLGIIWTTMSWIYLAQDKMQLWILWKRRRKWGFKEMEFFIKRVSTFQRKFYGINLLYSISKWMIQNKITLCITG